MEANKENIQKFKAITRIPLPVEPLPALPKHLVESKRTKSKIERHPLKTITPINSGTKPQLTSPGSSKNSDNNVSSTKQKNTLKIDTRHVTVRQKDYAEWPYNVSHPLKTITQINSGTKPQLTLPGSSENCNTNVSSTKQKYTLKIDTRHVTVRQKDDADWHYNVIKDDKKDDSNTIISDENVKNVAEKKRNSHEARTAVTPAFKSTLEPSRVKNIKRSLKRPHSRELQGLSPKNKEQRKGEEHVRRRLRFTESVHEKLKSPDFWKKSYMKCLCQDYTSDMFTYLLDVEQKVSVPRVSTLMRACVINWLMRVNTADGNPATIQAACWYLDSVLSTDQTLVDKLQLIAAACYWIAHKLHELCLPASRLVKASNYAFTTEGLLAAEKAVLERLKFPRQPVVPQEYITYLSWWCDNEHPGEIEVGATFLTTCFMMANKQSCSEYPSVIAAAAVRNALVLLRKVDLLMRLQACPVFKAAEKKAESLFQTCSLIRRAARAVASSTYEYKTPFEQYGVPPHYIAQKIVNAASKSVIINARTANNH